MRTGTEYVLVACPSGDNVRCNLLCIFEGKFRVKLVKQTIAQSNFLRAILFPIFRRVNFEIAIKHQVTARRFKLLTWEHKGYWYYGKQREQAELLMFQKLLNSGDCVLEVGGHIGYLTQIFEHIVGSDGRVIVMEPTPKSRTYLEKNVRQDTTVLPFAASETNGEMDFYTEEFGGFTNSLVSEFAESTNKWLSETQHEKASIIKISVPVRTLDSLCEEQGIQPNFLKIDVEGAELSVLRGAEKTLTHVRSLMVEVSRNHNEILRFLERLNYVPFDSDGERINEDIGGGNKNIFFQKID